MKKIANIIVNELAGTEWTLDEVKRCMRITMDVSGIEWSDRDWNELFDEVMYGLHLAEQGTTREATVLEMEEKMIERLQQNVDSVHANQDDGLEEMNPPLMEEFTNMASIVEYATGKRVVVKAWRVSLK